MLLYSKCKGFKKFKVVWLREVSIPSSSLIPSFEPFYQNTSDCPPTQSYTSILQNSFMFPDWNVFGNAPDKSADFFLVRVYI